MISNILGGRKMIPVVEKMEVFPVAGHDCMELNLSGAHAPYFRPERPQFVEKFREERRSQMHLSR